MSGDLVPSDPEGSSSSSPEWLAQLVENQKRELEIRAQELELQKQKDNNNLDFAKLSLAAQERDRADDRKCARETRKDFHKLVIGVVLVIAVLVGLAVVMGHDQIALEIVKAVIYLVAGGAGGYGVGKSRPKQVESNGQAASPEE